MEEYNRPTWDEYFLEVMHALQKRATCGRGRNACLIVKDNRILSTGYVGSPPGFPHCDEVGHLMKKMIDDDGEIHEHCVRTLHAEQNAICQAAKHGISLQDSTIYVALFPCRVCAMLLISVGVKRVVAEYKYHAQKESEEMFKHAGIQVDCIHDEEMKYEKNSLS